VDKQEKIHPMEQGENSSIWYLLKEQFLMNLTT